MSTPTTELFEGPDPTPHDVPDCLGRYRVVRELGRGGFGRVFLAQDDLLKRPVALKLLHLRFASTALVPALLAEARTIAQMDHPGIVPIFDVMETDKAEFCIVSRFVEGRTLRQRLTEPVTQGEAADLIRKLCEALHHAHKSGVVHRDVKPANIMITNEGQPVLLDFGLAKGIEDVAKNGTVAGTPGYMSPEQARGEDHLVGGRSDIYSLGLVFYEMLTGRRAFPVAKTDEQLRGIAAGEPLPPRDVSPQVARELSRICMKAINPQLRFRYPVAADMAEDLRSWQAALSETVIETSVQPALKSPARPTGQTQQIRVVPRGLRAFDEGDAEFFLKLVPGPRDQYGLPESLRFWKQRIESTEPRLAFRAGVLYGPSGCGKSSLVGAGLLPRCSGNVRFIFHEARHAGNDVRLARALHAEFPTLDPAVTNAASLIHDLRTRGLIIPPQKLLLVIDQAEQWLRAREDADNPEGLALLNTIRQCDGVHVQALLLVRDDFWRGVSRLLTEADVEIVGSNSALVDLFEPRHAEAVLESFGRAYQCLPEDPGVPLSEESRAFIRRAVENLSEGGKISPVRLALFTEMFRSRAWTVASLRDVGGASGVAVAFLEEVFHGASAGGPRRIHEPAARRVFEQLVPPTGDVRGPTRRQAALLEASGYASKPEAFHELMSMLDTDLRLLTPVDSDDEADREPAWQITHDYMVPALRQWLLAKKATTRRGRAEIALAERAREWEHRPAATRLPGYWEWVRLRALTQRSNWSLAETEWMQTGMRRVRLISAGAVLCAMIALLALGEWRNSVHGRALAEQILTAAPEDVSAMVRQGRTWTTWTRPILEQSLGSPVTSTAGLNARLALVATDPRHAETLTAAMLEADARTFGAIRDALRQTGSVRAMIFQEALEEPGATNARKLRAVAALATLQQNSPALTGVGAEVARWLVTSIKEMPAWAAHLQPLSAELSPALESMLASSGTESHGAAVALASLHVRRKEELIRLLHSFPAAEVHLLIDSLKGDRDAGKMLMAALAAAHNSRPKTPIAPGDEQAACLAECNLALACLNLGLEDQCWPYFSRQGHRPLRSEIVLHTAASGLPAEILVTRLRVAEEAGGRQALLMALRGYPLSALPAPAQETFVAWLLRAVDQEADGGVHSAILTLLKHWSLDKEPAAAQTISKMTPLVRPGMQWWVTPGGVDMRILVLPNQRRVAVGACEVTVGEYRRLARAPDTGGNKEGELSVPVTGMSWIDAARYCNWLTTKEGLGPEQLCYVQSEREWEPHPDALNRLGYRLPTKEEWIAAAANESDGSWNQSRGLFQATRYGWIAVNAGDRARPVATLLPNEQGLWDTLGNASEWTHDQQFVGQSRWSELMGLNYLSVTSQLLDTHPLRSAINFQKFQAGLRLARTLGEDPKR